MFYLTGCVVRLSSMSRMFSLGFIVELGDGHVFEPIAFFARCAVHGRITGRWRIGPMKMVKSRLSTIGLGFETKCAFDALTDEQQLRRRVSHSFVEHEELDPAIAFIQPHVIGRIRGYGHKRVGFEDG